MSYSGVISQLETIKTDFGDELIGFIRSKIEAYSESKSH